MECELCFELPSYNLSSGIFFFSGWEKCFCTFCNFYLIDNFYISIHIRYLLWKSWLSIFQLRKLVDNLRDNILYQTHEFPLSCKKNPTLNLLSPFLCDVNFHCEYCDCDVTDQGCTNENSKIFKIQIYRKIKIKGKIRLLGWIMERNS